MLPLGGLFLLLTSKGKRPLETSWCSVRLLFGSIVMRPKSGKYDGLLGVLVRPGRGLLRGAHVFVRLKGENAMHMVPGESKGTGLRPDWNGLKRMGDPPPCSRCILRTHSQVPTQHIEVMETI